MTTDDDGRRVMKTTFGPDENKKQTKKKTRNTPTLYQVYRKLKTEQQRYNALN